MSVSRNAVGAETMRLIAHFVEAPQPGPVGPVGQHAADCISNGARDSPSSLRDRDSESFGSLAWKLFEAMTSTPPRKRKAAVEVDVSPQKRSKNVEMAAC